MQLSDRKTRGTARRACLIAMNRGMTHGQAFGFARAIVGADTDFSRLGITPYCTGEETPPREPDDFLLPYQWQPIEPATYVLTVAQALWADGNN
jgi:hypothetical protein